MSGQRKRDDLTDGVLYRVVERPAGDRPVRADAGMDWVHTNYGHQGAPRTYMTLGAARSMRTHMRREQDNRRRWFRPTDSGQWFPEREFAVQVAPVTNWMVVPDDNSEDSTEENA